MSGVLASGAAVAGAGSDPLPQSLEGACRALEKEFALLVLRAMRKAMVPQGAGGSNGFARETAHSLLDSQWAELAVQGEGLGLWRAMVRQLGGADVKEPGPPADQGGKEAGHRTEAGHESQGGPGVPGPGLRRAGGAPTSSPHPGVPQVPAGPGLRLDRVL